MPASFFRRTAAGGVFMMKVNDLSEEIVISTGRIVSWPCVRELNSLQKAMMLIPCGPRAVPTGGAGLALPAGICSLTNPVTFFAIALLVNCPLDEQRSISHWPDLSRSGRRLVEETGRWSEVAVTQPQTNYPVTSVCLQL